jgi:hypothetical protein
MLTWGSGFVTVPAMKPTFAPYAPPSAVLAVINHYKNRDVPPSVTLTNLQQIGVTEGLAPRTMAALKFLGLLQDDGTTTDQFRALRYASHDDYRSVLAGILEAAYKGVLDHVELATAGDRELNNAFIPYSPGAQRSRMITLFQALAKEAGWTLAVTPKASSPRGTETKHTTKPQPRGLPKDVNRGASSSVSVDDRLTAEVSASGLRLSVTDADLAALPEKDFDTVWSALGLLQKARRQSLRAAKEMADQAKRRREDEAAGE